MKKWRKKFSHFTQADRDEMSLLRQKGYSYKDIGKAMGRAKSAIWTEMQLNKVNGTYVPVKANHKAYVRRKYSKYQGKKIVKNDDLQKEVETRLYDDQSPELVAGHISKHRKDLPSISKNAIYRYIGSVHGRRIEYYLGTRKKRRGKRRQKWEKIDGRRFIDERPSNIEKRSRIGDAEADFVVSGKSGKGIILVIADRKSRAPFLEKILPVTIENVHEAFVRIKKRFPEMRTITTDNDLLLRNHKELEKLLDVIIYFCHPYHSWEKGTVEAINRYVRRDIRKGSDISKYSKQFIHSIEEKLQRRPMKVLNFKSPQQILDMHRKRKEARQQQKNRKKRRSNWGGRVG